MDLKNLIPEKIPDTKTRSCWNMIWSVLQNLFYCNLMSILLVFLKYIVCLHVLEKVLLLLPGLVPCLSQFVAYSPYWLHYPSSKLYIYIYIYIYTHTHTHTHTVWQLYNETDFILTKIEVLSIKQCMPSMWPTFICNLETPQRPTLSMTGNTAPCFAVSERTWSK